MRKLNASGKARLSNSTLKKQNHKSKFENINGAFRFNNNDIQIDTLNFTSNGNKYELDGRFKNLLAYLFVENEALAVKTNFYTNKLVLEDFISDGTSKNYNFKLPKNIYFHFKAKVDTFQFRKFTATNIRGYLELDEQVLTATNVSFNATKGEYKGNIAIDDSQGDKILITSKGSVNKIDIQELFHQFENFGQTHILDKNIKGIASTDVEFASVWDKQLNVDKDKIYVLANIRVTKGELVDYKPILALSKFIEVEELEHIKFDNMATEIEIKNQFVNIPKTEINSSAIDVTLSGTHSFNNDIDYRFKLLLNDVLWKKAKKKKNDISEFGYIADDGLGKTTIFLKMVGTIDDYKISYDTKGLKENWGEKIEKEKNTLKTILNKEFGWFKNDSTIKKDDKKDDDGFIIEWEEETESKKESNAEDAKKKESTKKKKKEKKGLGKFIDDIAKPDEEEFEDFDDI